MGYYKLRDRIDFQGLPISVEQDEGDKRYWTDESTGEEGCTLMLYPYGYIRGTLGTDGDEVDVYVGPNEQSTKVFVITQNQKPEEGKAGSAPWVETDEQKVMLGFDSAKEAQAAYLQHYDDARFFGRMIELTMDDFKERLQSQKGELIKGKMAEGGFSKEEAIRIAKLMDVDLDELDITVDEWVRGLNEELEHKDVTKKRAIMTGKIALDHLKEDPKYYSKLAKVEKSGFGIGSNHPLLRESLRGTEQLGWFTDPDYLPPRTRLFVENNKVILDKPESDAQTKDLNDTNHRLARLNRKLKGTKVYKGLKDGRSLAIMLEDNIPMLTLSKSTANKEFNPAVTDSAAEKIKKYKGGKEHPVSEDQRRWAYAAEERGELPEGTAEKWSERAEGKDLPKDTSKKSTEKAEKSMEVNKRSNAVEVLKKAQASLTEEMDLKKQNKACKSQEEEEEEQEDTEKSVTSEFDLKKALQALVVSSMSKRARMDAAYQLGQAASRSTPINAEPAEITNLNVGTDRSRPTHEPPVVPVRRVETPRGANQTVDTMKSCSVHGYVHKSEASCPLCVQSGISEAKPYWRR